MYNQYTAVLFSQIVGYDSLNYGRTGVEEEYDNYLESHTRPGRGSLLTTLRKLLVNHTTTDNVTLTINHTCRARWPRRWTVTSRTTPRWPGRS